MYLDVNSSDIIDFLFLPVFLSSQCVLGQPSRYVPLHVCLHPLKYNWHLFLLVLVKKKALNYTPPLPFGHSEGSTSIYGGMGP